MAKQALLDQYGQPLPPTLARVNAMQRPMALGGTSGEFGRGTYPYEAASFGSESAEWFSWLYSADTETNPMRDLIVARQRDLVRNDGWASGLISALCDNIVGASFRLIAHPDYNALAQMSGNSGFDSQWADDFRKSAEALWRTWADDPNRWCDTERSLTMTEMMYLALRHKLIDGDCLALMNWQPDDVVPGKARYNTRFQLLDPDLLSNPNLQPDSPNFRGGVEIDAVGVARAYWFRKAHPGNLFSTAQAFTWERVERETAWGRPIVVHDFEALRAGQHRGGIGVLTPVLLRFKMLSAYDKTELQAAILQATMPMFIESPYDPQMVSEALGDNMEVAAYNDFRANYHEAKRFQIAGAKVPMLFPGEKIGSVDTSRPNSNFAQFEHAVLRSISTTTGLSAEQVTHDYSMTNYSSNRAAMIEAWKTLSRRRHDFVSGFARPIYGCWLEEAMSNGELPMPKSGNVPSFGEMRAAYSGCHFIGPAKGHVDPTKEIQADILALDAGLKTLQMICAEQGTDWEEVLQQRAIENDKIKELGLTPMAWTGQTLMPTTSEPGDTGEAPGSNAVPSKKTITNPQPA